MGEPCQHVALHLRDRERASNLEGVGQVSERGQDSPDSIARMKHLGEDASKR